MSFPRRMALSNIKGRPGRSLIMTALVFFLSFAVFTGAVIIVSLQRGLAGYRARLGADVIVVPNAATSRGAVDDILLQGITGNYYMAKKDLDKVRAADGIAACSAQFYLTSAKASCCSTRVQIIGYDPETDFVISPWIAEQYEGQIGDGDLVVGANLSVPESRTITFYGVAYRVAAQLAETGTGLDSAVYTNMNTMRQMAENASRLLDQSYFDGVDIKTAASALLIRVEEGTSIESVVDDINIHVTKVKASSAKSMVSQIAQGLGSVSRVIGILVAVIWGLALGILIAVFSLLSGERKKEFAILRTAGASRSQLRRIMAAESLIVSLTGALLGLAFSALLLGPVTESLKDALALPVLLPSFGTLLLLALGAASLSVLAALVTALAAAGRICRSETGLLLREDA